jgi:predicted O-methyltransferase YrrM
LGFSGQKWPQSASEIDGFAALLRDEGIKSYLEIGSLYGDTFHFIGGTIGPGARLVAVDLPGWKLGQPIGKHKRSGYYLKAAARDLRKSGNDARVVIGDSHDEKTIAKVMADQPFDAVMIDGDHTFEGAVADWLNYGSMARIVAFHDIVGIADVTRLWRHAREGKRWQEILSGEVKNGIGVLWNE